MTFETYPEFLTVEQAATYLDVRPATIRRMLRQHGMGDFLRGSMGKQVRIRRSDLDAMNAAGEATGPAAEQRPARGRKGAA